MAERNKFIPYPKELVSSSSNLENYLSGIALGDPLFCYQELPEVVSSLGMENFANWLGELTNADSAHQERGAVIFYDKRRSALSFPSNPQIGDEEIELIYPQNPECIFVADSHSHPDSSCFSTEFGDLCHFLSCQEDHGLSDYVKAMQVSTSKYNYLLLRTKNTPALNGNSGFGAADRIYYGAEYHYLLNEFKDLYKYESEYRWALSQELRGKLLYKTSDMFFQIHFLLPIKNYAAALKNKLGFYFSKKDGKYMRVNKEQIFQIVKEAVENRSEIEEQETVLLKSIDRS